MKRTMLLGMALMGLMGQTSRAELCLFDSQCRDENACTVNERCVLFLCVRDAKVCELIPNPCIHSTCNFLFGCQSEPSDSPICNPSFGCSGDDECDDNDPCTIDECSSIFCTHAPFCDDGNPCTVDTCTVTHLVVPTCSFETDPAQCDDGDDCTVDVCDSTGGCISTPQGCPDTTQCSPDGIICKEIAIGDEDGDGLVEAGEFVDFGVTIQVNNRGRLDWKKAQVRDRFGTEFDVTIAGGVNPTNGTASITSDSTGRESINWRLGVVPFGRGESLELSAQTVQTGGVQQFAVCGLHKINAGASVTFTLINGSTGTANTGIVTIPVLTADGLGDCDGDGASDNGELEAGTNPFDPNSVP